MNEAGVSRAYDRAMMMLAARGRASGELKRLLIRKGEDARVVGMIIERFAYRPVRKYSRMTTLIMAIGVSLLIENLYVATIGAAPRAFHRRSTRARRAGCHRSSPARSTTGRSRCRSWG